MVALTNRQRALLARRTLAAEEDCARGDSDAQRGESISTIVEKPMDNADDDYEPRDTFWSRLRERVGL